MTSIHPMQTSIRLARPNEYPAAIRVLTRAFTQDPAFNWYGGVKQAVPHYESNSADTVKTMRNLRYFQEAVLKMTVISGGYVVVVVVPNGTKGIQQPGEEKEMIIGVTLWLKPGQSLDLGILDIIRSGGLKALWGWGFMGLKRVFLDFTPAVERSLEKGPFRVDATNQACPGICSLMMKDGFTRTTPKPVHLEATKARTRDIYAHFGFEVDEEHQFGVGSVDENGIRARGEKATGYPEWVMTKWNYTS
ncbi:hypothetical protein C8J55DRAFT_555632 [Lentinula edodes]|uniref:N-acetyltransferase domain-containing protein n=1 Tax=Lentinula lateritia TaxID=40482 RepID=A0A9W9DZC9_9AGAR|nr:hypothetical protein C8J55DRAFT_555632 [Lentinula edodes]